MTAKKIMRLRNIAELEALPHGAVVQVKLGNRICQAAINRVKQDEGFELVLPIHRGQILESVRYNAKNASISNGAVRLSADFVSSYYDLRKYGNLPVLTDGFLERAELLKGVGL
jgi:hypothetical protein